MTQGIRNISTVNFHFNHVEACTPASASRRAELHRLSLKPSPSPQSPPGKIPDTQPQKNEETWQYLVACVLFMSFSANQQCPLPGLTAHTVVRHARRSIMQLRKHSALLDLPRNTTCVIISRTRSDPVLSKGLRICALLFSRLALARKFLVTVVSKQVLQKQLLCTRQFLCWGGHGTLRSMWILCPKAKLEWLRQGESVKSTP